MAIVFRKTALEQAGGGQDHGALRGHLPPSNGAIAPDVCSKERTNGRRIKILTIKIFVVAGLVCVLQHFAKIDHHTESIHQDPAPRTVNENTVHTADSHSMDQKSLREMARAQYANCTVSFVPPQPRLQESEWRKPLWVPSFPASGSASPSKKGDLTKQLIDTITGLKQGTKNYHMSMKGGKLRRCKGISETAACTQGHPYVPVGPESQTANFQPWVVFAIRNFATAFPASHTDKNIAYHNAKGQASEEEWRKVRDQYLESSMESWRAMIRWWQTAEYYQIALYLPFEWLLSPTKGPGVVQELARVYERAGFQVAPSNDIPCIWYQVASQEWQRQEALYEYIPGYTLEQRNFIVRQFEEQINETSHDPTLTSLLEEYKVDVLRNTILDQLAGDE